MEMNLPYFDLILFIYLVYLEKSIFERELCCPAVHFCLFVQYMKVFL